MTLEDLEQQLERRFSQILDQLGQIERVFDELKRLVEQDQAPMLQTGNQKQMPVAQLFEHLGNCLSQSMQGSNTRICREWLRANLVESGHKCGLSNVMRGADGLIHIKGPYAQPVWVGFSCDKTLPSGKNLPRTARAGALFSEMRKVLRGKTSQGRGFLAYVGPDEMDKYFNNPNNGHHVMFGLAPGQSTDISRDYFASKPATFMKEMGAPFQGKVTCRWEQALPERYFMRVFEVG